MPGWIESRILKAEDLIQSLYRRLQALVDQVKALSDSMRANAQQQPTSAPAAPSQGGGIYVCLVPQQVAGNPPNNPNAFSAAVYQVQGGAYIPMGNQYVWVGIPGPTVPNAWGYCVPDGQSGYVLISQSCT